MPAFGGCDDVRGRLLARKSAIGHEWRLERVPPSPTPWRIDPEFAGRFHPQYPDDLQVIVHDGESRRTKRQPEACWVRAHAVPYALRYAIGSPDAESSHGLRYQVRRIYQGTLLNPPQQLELTRVGEDLLFMHVPGLPHPLQVRPDYLKERLGWSFIPCESCGIDQGLDPPSVMARTRFPDQAPDVLMEAFTSFCPCGGRFVVVALTPDASQHCFIGRNTA